MKKCAEHRLRWSEPAYRGDHAMQGTMPGEARGITWPSLPSNGRGHQTHEKGTPPGSPIVTHIAATREMHQAGQAASYSVTKGTMHGCVATPTGRLRKGKPANTASKRISAPGSQGAQQGSHAWLLSLTNKPVASGSTPSRVAGYLVRRQRQGRDTACCHEE